MNGDFVHTIKTTGESSHGYGNCDICGKHCTEVFVLDEARYYQLPDIIAMERNVPIGTLALTYANCESKFGHKNCLENYAKTRKNRYE